VELWGKCETDPSLAADAILALLKHGKPGPERVLMAAVGAMLLDEAIRHLRKLSGAEISIRMVQHE
jgi:hypothetical protein